MATGKPLKSGEFDVFLGAVKRPVRLVDQVGPGHFMGKSALEYLPSANVAGLVDNQNHANMVVVGKHFAFLFIVV